MKNNLDHNHDAFIRSPLTLPNNSKDLLLLVCCAPCAGEILEALAVSPEINTKVLFYNPNIYPETEYIKRKEEFIQYANKHKMEIIDAEYEVDKWYKEIEGLEDQPEQGKRCTKCFAMRLKKTAEIAEELGIEYISSTLAISRWKNFHQVNAAAKIALEKHPNIKYWDHNWRKGGGGVRMYTIAKKEEFYMQDYCGCEFSIKK